MKLEDKPDKFGNPLSSPSLEEEEGTQRINRSCKSSTVREDREGGNLVLKIMKGVQEAMKEMLQS